jgi:serine/threonine protein kinase
MGQRLAAGFRLGQYVVVRLVGKGGMAEVYEANEPLLQRRVALKVIAADDLDGPTAIDLFFSEGKTLAQINHPNVVTIYQLGVDQGIHYIAMELVDGDSLEQIIRKNKIDHERAIVIFSKILAGVQALHRKGIVHRDLKPNNIIISSDQKVKIVDFGIAEIISNTQKETKAGFLRGSVPYMSPEVARGEPATFQSDIWSLGVILFCLLTGKRPFTGSNVREILEKIKNETLNISMLNSLNISSQAQALIQRMCNRSLEIRYSSIDQIINEFSIPLTQNQIENKRNISNIQSIKWGITASLVLALCILIFKFTETRKEKEPGAPAVAIAMPTAEPPTPLLRPPMPPVEMIPSPATSVVVENTSLAKQEDKTPIEVPVTKAKHDLRKKPLAKVRLKSATSLFELNTSLLGDNRSPAAKNNPIRNLPILIWSSSAGAEAYQVQIATDSHFSRILVATNTPDTYFKWSKPLIGHFFWRVRAAGHRYLNSEFSQLGQLTVKLAPPKTLHPQYSFQGMSKNKVGSEQIIDWTSTRFVDAYEISVSKDSSMKKSILNQVVTEPKIKLNLASGTYFLSIVALDSNREPASLASKPIQIEVKNAITLVSPHLKQPPNEIVVANQGTMITPIACQWSTNKATNEFDFQLSADANFDRITHATRIHENQYLLTIPLPRGKFFWRVRSVLKEDTSKWSKPYQFTIE